MADVGLLSAECQETMADSHIVLWTLLIPVVVTQLPGYSTSSFGNCADPPSLLGGQLVPSTDGLIPLNLLVTAQNSYSPGDEFYTTERPEVLIFSSKITCKSDSPFRNNSFGSIAVLVSYSCRGVACRQRPSEVQTLMYLHHFAFACETNDSTLFIYGERRVNSFTLYNQGYSEVNRDPSNHIVDTTIADAGSCRHCGIIPFRFPDYEPVTGCFSMLDGNAIM